MAGDSPDTAEDGSSVLNAEAASAQEPPAKKKRGASHQMTKDNFEDGDNDGDDESQNEEKLKQGFKRASDEVISKRKIYKVRKSFATVTATATATATGSSDDKETAAKTDNDTTNEASTTPATASTTNGSNNPFVSTILTSETSTSPKKVFGFGSASGFGAATSGLSAGSGSAGFGGFGSSGKASGFGSSVASGKSSGFVFGSSSSTANGGTTKSLFGNAGASGITFSLSKKSDTSKDDSASAKETDTDKTTKLPDKVDLKTGEEDEEAIHSGRCKSFEWVAADDSGAKPSADGNDDGDSKQITTNPSVQSSTQFQAISTVKSSNDDENEKNSEKGEKSDSKIASESGNHRWMELGIGPVKILRSKSNPGRLRMVQRRESSKMGPATKVILNVPLWRESTCERDRQAQQYLRLKTMKEGKMCQYSLKFKENSDAGYFHHHLTEHIPLARKCFSAEAATTAGEMSDNPSGQKEN